MRKRQHRIWAHLSDDEYISFRNNVKKTGLSQEVYLRALIEGNAPKERPPMDYYGMMKELHAIGNRMNQIAARAHATGFFLADEYDKAVKELNNSLLEIQSTLLPEKAKAVKSSLG